MSNVTLIGMPGCGKSTVGVVLAKVLGCRFLDCDLLIQDKMNKLLNELISEYGNDGFLKIENDIISGIAADSTVIATGGSAVYGKDAMEHLKKISVIVYIELPIDEILHRLGDLDERGVVVPEGETFEQLYNERCILYRKYADVTVNALNMQVREVVAEIKKALAEI